MTKQTLAKWNLKENNVLGTWKELFCQTWKKKNSVDLASEKNRTPIVFRRQAYFKHHFLRDLYHFLSKKPGETTGQSISLSGISPKSHPKMIHVAFGQKGEIHPTAQREVVKNINGLRGGYINLLQYLLCLPIYSRVQATCHLYLLG